MDGACRAARSTRSVGRPWREDGRAPGRGEVGEEDRAGGREREAEEARVAGVEDAEAIPPAPHAEERPGLAIGDDNGAEVLRLPLRVHLGVVPRGVHEERAVAPEVAVEEDEVPVELRAGGEAEGRLRGSPEAAGLGTRTPARRSGGPWRRSQR